MSKEAVAAAPLSTGRQRASKLGERESVQRPGLLQDRWGARREAQEGAMGPKS